MKVDKWDDRYDPEVKMTNPADLRVTKGNLLTALNEQEGTAFFSNAFEGNYPFFCAACR